MATYTVYIVSYRSIPIFHEGIYVEEATGKGWVYQVTGGRGPGWKYEMGRQDNIESSPPFHAKYAKGTIAQADLDKVDPICRTIAMPRDEYREGVQLRRDCRHWVRNALDEMQKQGLLRP